jgi:hypothetical protein
MSDKFADSHDVPLNLDMVRDELARVPVIGRESDRELFLDLPVGGLAAPRVADTRQPAEREFLSNDFTHGS